MNNLILSTGVILLLTNPLLSDELEPLIIIDESSNSTITDQKSIVGCTEESHKKEDSCSKKAEEIILNKLPTSQQMSEIDEESNSDIEKIKKQLSTILEELSELKKSQKADRETIKELKEIIAVLSTEKKVTPKKKITLVKKKINRLATKNERRYTDTRIRKPIKEISRSDSEVIIEVQNNESLSTYAQYYFNDNRQYYKIYKANRDKINESLQITVGDHLKIPLY